ncbi:hypothetical protein [Streptomyces phaeofaciens]|uniref:hypothetical protein n=1 Tax=Streptomyces phaeofaciens TaxID=68254 RepID=UPI001672692F|nr:hypothetical protein [Streptomyces phaeofaciens]
MGRLRDKITGTRYPETGAVALPVLELRQALLDLGWTDAPFRVRGALPAEKADLVAECRVPEASIRLRTRMRFDPHKREVRVLEERWEPSREHAGTEYSRGPAVSVSKQWRYEKGPDGRRRKVETFRFDSRDMRNPLVDAVLGAGWTWRGVLLRW